MEKLNWIITDKEYSKNKKKFQDPLRMMYSWQGFAFEREWECVLLEAQHIEEGDFLIMNNNKLFQVDVIEMQYANDEIADKYRDKDFSQIMEMEDIPEETIYDFIDEDKLGANGVSLNSIPFDAKFLTIRVKPIEDGE